MKGKILSFIMSLIIIGTLINVPFVYAGGNWAFSGEYSFGHDEKGAITITIIDEETNELFTEDCNFYIIQCEKTINSSELNPYTINDVSKNVNYSIVYLNSENKYDGYEYRMDFDKSDYAFYYDSQEDNKEITIYMLKYYFPTDEGSVAPVDEEKSIIQTNKEYTFEDVYKLTTKEIEALFEAKGMTWEKGYHIFDSDSVLNNGFYKIKLDPKPFIKNSEVSEITTEVYNLKDVHNLIENDDVIWDLDKIYSSLDLSPELFDIQADVSMTCLEGNEQTGSIYRKYCICTIKPIAENEEDAVSLYTAMLNYVQLKTECAGIHFEGLGAGGEYSFTYIRKQDYTNKGDVNSDRKFDICDVVEFQRWLLGVPNVEIIDWKAADFCEDNRLDIFDLTAMKKALINIEL